MTAHRNIGGSILPSSEARILQPVETMRGVMQVRVLPDEDAHGLFLGDTLIAKHPNGYSCFELAARLKDEKNAKRAVEQADYIKACGGFVAESFYTHNAA